MLCDWRHSIMNISSEVTWYIWMPPSTTINHNFVIRISGSLYIHRECAIKCYLYRVFYFLLWTIHFGMKCDIWAKFIYSFDAFDFLIKVPQNTQFKLTSTLFWTLYPSFLNCSILPPTLIHHTRVLPYIEN